LSLVMQLSDRVVVMDNGKKIAEGRPETVTPYFFNVTSDLNDQPSFSATSATRRPPATGCSFPGFGELAFSQSIKLLVSSAF
jgi:energy-coupling factor transporter ATP-binding protein EcfA2